MGAKITLKGNPVELEGPELKAGDKAPDFTTAGPDLKPVTLEAFKGKRKVFLTIPSVDTPVCDKEIRRFNEEAANLPGVEVAVVSVDTPFAFKRWCGAAGVDKVRPLSDFRGRSFGKAYGVDIKNLGIHARAVFVADENDVLTYVEYVPEVGQEPSYDKVLGHLKGAAAA